MTFATRIAATVATYYGTDLNTLLRKYRKESVWLRAVTIRAAMAYPQVSLADLSRALFLCHTTVMHLRDARVAGNRPVEVEPDLARLIAIGAKARSRMDTCASCGGTGKVAREWAA